MARKRSEPAAPPPYAEVVVLRPNGVEYLRTPCSASDVRFIMGEAWRVVTSELGWIPNIRVIRKSDGVDITAFI